jgi:hypothetical protein
VGSTPTPLRYGPPASGWFDFQLDLACPLHRERHVRTRLGTGIGRGVESERDWWWSRASPKKRLVFSLVMLPVAALVLYSFVSDPSRMIHHGTIRSRVAGVLSPFLVLFVVWQVIRAIRDLRDPERRRSSTRERELA